LDNELPKFGLHKVLKVRKVLALKLTKTIVKVDLIRKYNLDEVQVLLLPCFCIVFSKVLMSRFISFMPLCFYYVQMLVGLGSLERFVFILIQTLVAR
jgi:hypothetical protein